MCRADVRPRHGGARAPVPHRQRRTRHRRPRRRCGWEPTPGARRGPGPRPGLGCYRPRRVDGRRRHLRPAPGRERPRGRRRDVVGVRQRPTLLGGRARSADSSTRAAAGDNGGTAPALLRAQASRAALSDAFICEQTPAAVRATTALCGRCPPLVSAGVAGGAATLSACGKDSRLPPRSSSTRCTTDPAARSEDRDAWLPGTAVSAGKGCGSAVT